VTLRQQWTLVGAIVAVLIGGLGAGLYALRDQLFPVEIGSTAPDFRGRTVDGSNRVHSLADYRGKVIVLNLWATWCEPCKVEMPSFEALHRQMANSDLRIVAVSIDDAVGADSVRAYARDLGLTFEILLDSMHVIDRDYQVTGYPETFVIARDGTIRKKWIGPADWTSPANVALLRDLLGQ
jgi:cytochrome c biogenesis protein CcmG/thiol:disulfide interchange protein DsbE